jgi:hypothetical protein
MLTVEFFLTVLMGFVIELLITSLIVRITKEKYNALGKK